MSTNASTNRDAFNAGSDTSEHYTRGTAHEQYQRMPVTTATPTRAKGQSIVHDLPQGGGIAASTVQDR